MKLLITGGAGFMGSNFIKYILDKYLDYKIINLDKLTYAGNLENLKEIEDNPRYTFMKGDIADNAIVEKIFKEDTPDAVINYAAETHVDRSILDPKAFIKTDVLGTYNLLEACRKFSMKKYVQISTDEVYGSVEDGSFTEKSPFDPSSPYSASKAGGDHLVIAYYKTYGLPVVRTHSCNFFGPYQYPEKLIPLFITNILEEKKIPVYGDGTQVREWIYTQDHCSAVDFILRHGKMGEIYNIGTGQEKQNMEVTKLILKYLGKDESSIEYVKDRPGHDIRYSLDHTKLRELGWQPRYQFEDALKSTIEWYKAHEDWWKKIKSGKYLEYYKTQYQI